MPNRFIDKIQTFPIYNTLNETWLLKCKNEDKSEVFISPMHYRATYRVSHEHETVLVLHSALRELPAKKQAYSSDTPVSTHF
jgi:hypothetical protein